MSRNRKRHYRVVSNMTLMSLLATPVCFAQLSDIENIFDEIDVGTRVPGRTFTETSVPVDVISGDAMRQTGFTETSQALQFLAPAFNFSTSAISDGTDIVRPSTLRGLGPDQVLVLINGKRRHKSALTHVNGSIGRGSSGTDLNAIPLNAIERIEILRDGAAAQYGSDAIAGVINIVLRNQVGTTELRVTGGQTYETDGRVLQASANTGFQIGDTGFANLTLELRQRDPTNRAGPDLRQQFMTLPDGSPDPREATFDRLNHRYGDAESDNIYFAGNIELALTDDIDWYTFGTLSRRDGGSAGFFRRALESRNRPAIHPEGFLPFITSNVDDNSLSSGIRTRAGLWDVDASLTWGENTYEFGVENSVNVSLGDNSPTAVNSGTLSFREITANIDFFRQFDWGMQNLANIAVGLEYRQDSYKIEAGEFASYANGPDNNPATAARDQFGEPAAPGIQLFPGFRPENEVDEERNNFAFYIDIEIEPAPDIVFSAAGRYENYSDFGENFSGKFTVRYQATPTLAARGGISSGFRAPSLQQQFFNNTGTQFVTLNGVPNVPVEVGTFRNDSEVAEVFRVPQLQEETSLNISGGLVYTPTSKLTITADAYAVDVNDRVILSGRFSTENEIVAELLEPFPEIGAAQFFTNAIDITTTGFDLVANYEHTFDHGGILKFVASGNWASTELDGDVRTPARLEGFGETLFNRQEITWLEDGQPNSRVLLGFNYQWQGFTGILRFNYFGDVKSTESISDDTLDQTFSGKWLTDIEANYTFDNGLQLAIGANNVLDETPDENIAANTLGGIFPFNRRTTPFGFNGGYYYARLSYTFDH